MGRRNALVAGSSLVGLQTGLQLPHLQLPGGEALADALPLVPKGTPFGQVSSITPSAVIKGCWQLSGYHKGDKQSDRTYVPPVSSPCLASRPPSTHTLSNITARRLATLPSQWGRSSELGPGVRVGPVPEFSTLPYRFGSLLTELSNPWHDMSLQLWSGSCSRLSEVRGRWYQHLRHRAGRVRVRAQRAYHRGVPQAGRRHGEGRAGVHQGKPHRCRVSVMCLPSARSYGVQRSR